MVRRIAVPNLAAIYLLIVGSACYADQPLVLAELQSQHAIAQSDWAQAEAERELAAWKLVRLGELQSQGHASWQEVAEQEVVVASATAATAAAEHYLQAVADWQSRLAGSQLPPDSADYECIRLYMPRMARLVAWMPTDVASNDQTKRHLGNLRRRHQSASDIDLSSLRKEVENARQAIATFGRNVRAAHLLTRAEIQLRLAIAKYESAKARKAAAKIYTRRMVLVRDSLRANRTENQHETTVESDQRSKLLAQIGTRFVDSSSDRELSQLVNAMAADDSIDNERIGWLEHERSAAADRVNALRKLLQHKHANQDEYDRAKAQHSSLELQIEQTRQAVRLQQQVADHYKQVSDSDPIVNVGGLATLDENDPIWADANVVRHSLELQKRKLRATASRAAVAARRDYLAERMRRVERIPQRLRAPKELDHARHKVQGAQQQFAIVGREIAALVQEQRRFERQLRSQRSEQYQLVQVGGGHFIGREQLELARVWIAAVGFVGQSDFFPYWPGMHPYIESSILFDCTSDLLVDRPYLTAEQTRCDGWRTCDTLLRRSVVSSIWNAPYSTSRLRLTADWIDRPQVLFCDRPYVTRQMELRYNWVPREHFSLAREYRFRSCYPWASADLFAANAIDFCRPSVLSYRIDGPTCSVFPYHSKYLFWSAFPRRSILYANPYTPPSPSFSGLGYTDWLNSSCLDSRRIRGPGY